MKEYVLLTGASSGIGYEMAWLLAEKKMNLILVARSEDKLDQMQEALIRKYGVSVYYIVKDLTDARAAIELYEDILREKLYVTALIHNAGVGHYGRFIDIEAADELKMIELNVSSVVVLTKLFAKEMTAYGNGRIMNISSLLAFLPFPYYAVYSATKAFILAFSETVAAELEHTGVVVTALCPGPVDTGFNSENMRTTNAFQANKPMSARAVAEQGVKFLLHGQGTKVVGFRNRLLSYLPHLVPGKIMMKIKKKLASQQNERLNKEWTWSMHGSRCSGRLYRLLRSVFALSCLFDNSGADNSHIVPVHEIELGICPTDRYECLRDEHPIVNWTILH